MKKTYHKENLKKLNKAAIEIIVNEEVGSALMMALATLVIFFCSAIVTVKTTRNFRILQFTNFSFKHLINTYSSFNIFLVHRL